MEEEWNGGEKNRSQIGVQAQGEKRRHEMSLVTAMDAVGNDPWGAEPTNGGGTKCLDSRLLGTERAEDVLLKGRTRVKLKVK